MLTGKDVVRIVDRAKSALEGDSFRVGGGWRCRPTTRAPYVGAAFEWDGKPWVVCRGFQSPTQAQLLDATTGLMHTRDAAYALALLKRPPEIGVGQLPAIEYQIRERAAAWQAWGVLWVNDEEFDPDTVQLDQELGPTDLALMESAMASIVAAATPAWAQFRHSPDAEPYIRAALDPILAQFGFRPAPRSDWSFRAFWRGAKCDGLWTRPGRAPRTLALEVKVSEDATAPICQVTDDIGQFGAVLAVRLCTEEPVRQRVEDDAHLRKARERCAQKLPIAFLSLRFCALCGQPLRELAYPNLLCGDCDQRALGAGGAPPRVRTEYDEGENPVFVEGKKCWRRYRFWGWVTMLDVDDCPTQAAFDAKHTTAVD